MLSRTLLFSAGTLALLVGATMSVLWLRQPDISTKSSEPVVATQSILIAAHPIAAGTLLRATDMAWGDVPAPEVVDTNIVGGIVSEPEFVGAVTKHAFAAREALTTTALVKPGDPDFLVAALAPHFRAVSIAVDATQSTSGLVLPGDRVDVVLTQNFAAEGAYAGRKSVGETVLRDLRVIAVDQALTTAPRPATPLVAQNEMKLPKTVTLEVTERQASVLLVAEQLGKIELALRGRRDPAASASGNNEDAPVWAFDVSRAFAPPGQVAAATAEVARGPQAAPVPPAQRTIAVIRGSKVERLCATNAGLLACP